MSLVIALAACLPGANRCGDKAAGSRYAPQVGAGWGDRCSLLAEGSWGPSARGGGFGGELCSPAHHLPGRRDSSGIRLYYTATLRRFDAGIMELGLVYTPVMAIPPQEVAFVLTGYCTDKCTQMVSGAALVPPLRSCRWPSRKGG